MSDPSHHFITRNSWLRAAVMGANDGIISTAGLLVGMSTAGSVQHTLFITGMAGLVAGATSMAAGEFVSVSSQADMERADLRREAEAISNDFADERQELQELYQQRGLSADLAKQVAAQLMDHAALETHAREELGIHSHNQANPIQAALVSALTFSAGAMVPILSLLVSPQDKILHSISAATLLCLLLLGFISAKAGGASPLRAILRIGFWGVAALVFGSVIGHGLGQI